MELPVRVLTNFVCAQLHKDTFIGDGSPLEILGSLLHLKSYPNSSVDVAGSVDSIFAPTYV